MPDPIHIRPTPKPEGQRPLVVYLYDGTRLPAEGKRVVVDRHVRMLLKDGDVEKFTPEPRKPREPKADATAEPEPTKKPRAARAEEQSE